MDDYISREKALQFMLTVYASREANRVTVARGVAEAIAEYIKAVPAADVQPVVFCKDCKWYRESELLAPNRFCFRLKGNDGKPVGYNFADMDFCSYGERREGGGT